MMAELYSMKQGVVSPKESVKGYSLSIFNIYGKIISCQQARGSLYQLCIVGDRFVSEQLDSMVQRLVHDKILENPVWSVTAN